MRGRKKRILMPITLSCLLVFMGVGFAVARTTLNIGGTSTAINTWDVRITDLVAKENETGAKSSNAEINEILGTSAIFSASQCEGDVTCDAYLKSIVPACIDENTCYKYDDETKTAVLMPENAQFRMGGYINSDPSIGVYESF